MKLEKKPSRRLLIISVIYLSLLLYWDITRVFIPGREAAVVMVQGWSEAVQGELSELKESLINGAHEVKRDLKEFWNE